MSKKILFFTSVIAILFVSSAWSAIPVDRDWTNGGGNQLWTNPANWSGGTIPTSAEKAAIRSNSAAGPIINSTMAAVANEVVIGDHATTDVLTMSGGTLTTSGTNAWIILGYNSGNAGTIALSGGAITVPYQLFIGFAEIGNAGGTGTLNMTGGTIDCTGTPGMVAIGATGPTGNGTGSSPVGTVLLHGGTITCTSFYMGNATCSMDITTGTLVINSTVTDVATYVTNGWITAYGGAGTVNVVVGASTTTVTATPGATPKAHSPDPVNGATGVAQDATMSWTAGEGAVSHDVYFGTSDPPAFVGNQTAATYDPGTLTFGATYYWRVDEIDASSNVTTGDVWHFAVKTGQATSPDPANGATNVDLDAGLSWIAGFDGATHDVYFGTDQAAVTNAALLAGDLDRSGCVDWLDVRAFALIWLQPADFIDFSDLAANWEDCTSSVFKGNLTGDPAYGPTLDSDTAYYWRIDEVGGSQTVKGNVWSFNTASLKATNPSPTNGATGVAISQVLSWTAGWGALDHDVYFGTTNPPPLVSEQAGTTYSPTLAANTTYYWRIDEDNASGLTVGDPWTFTTGAAIPTDVDWIDGGDHLWKTAANWSGSVLPSSVDKAAIRTGQANGPIIDATTTAVANECVVGDWSSADDNLNITGGSLTLGGLNNWLILGYQAPNHGTLNMSDGMVTIPDPCGVMFVGFMGVGTLNMTGGTINVGQAFGVAQNGGTGQVNLDGGTIIADALNIPGSGVVDINNGTFIIRGDARTAVDALITAGKLTAFNGLGSVAVDYNNVNPGMTTVTGTFAKASAPSPANGATGVLVGATLSWTAGMGAVSHDVYFGTTNPPAFIGNQGAASYDPGGMNPATTYYWRIDEIDASSNVATGTVWSFTTQALKAANPNPANNATGVATSIFLQWSPGYGATSHDVYFGTTNPPAFLENTTATASDPGTLAQGVTYFWRVNEVSGSGTTTGDLWQFQTQLPPPPANLRKGPYLLYPAVNTQMSVLFQLTATSSATVDWGTDTTYSVGTMTTTEYGTDHQHRANLTGLTPGTKYYYKVTIGTSFVTGSFTAAPAASATAVKFFMYGDTRTNPGINNTNANRMIALYTADPGYQTICLHAGDWVEGDNENTWTSQWFTNNSTTTQLYQLMREVPLAGCIGNHEGESCPVFKKYHPFPLVANNYFSFDYGPVHVAIVDMYTSYTSGSAQYNWLVNDLSTSTKLWKIIVFHEPAWNAGGSHGNNGTAQSVFQPLAQTYGAEICLAGHNHFYSRCAVPLSGTHTIQHITHGAGGAPYYSLDLGQPYVVAGIGNTPVVGKVEINGDTLTQTAYNSSSGAVIDTITINHSTW